MVWRLPLRADRVLSRQVWLLEMNCNPALHTNCEVLKEVVPRTVVETLGQSSDALTCYMLTTEITGRFYTALCYLFTSLFPLIPDLSLEIFHKCRLRQPMLPLASQRDFVLLYNGACPSEKNSSRGSNQKNAKTSPKTCTSNSEPVGKMESLTLAANPPADIRKNSSPSKEDS